MVADATYYELGEEPTSHYWMPFFQAYAPRVNFVVAARGPVASLSERTGSVLLGLDPNLAVPPSSTLDDAFQTQIARYRTAARLVSLFGAMALLLAAVGLYGVLSYFVVQRSREIGIRMALGATRSRVASTIVGSGLRLTLVGVALGLVGALLSTRFVASFLYGVQPTDATTFVGAPVILVLVTYLACLVPARRAASVDAVRAIRCD